MIIKRVEQIHQYAAATNTPLAGEMDQNIR
jgi:hypothetical protein